LNLLLKVPSSLDVLGFTVMCQSCVFSPTSIDVIMFYCYVKPNT